MSAECDIHGTDLLYDDSGYPNYCPSCELDQYKAHVQRLIEAARAVDGLYGHPIESWMMDGDTPDERRSRARVFNNLTAALADLEALPDRRSDA